jgi:hypothetical protein
VRIVGVVFGLLVMRLKVEYGLFGVVIMARPVL